MSEQRRRQVKRRKQPKMRRLDTAVPLRRPQLQLPKAARQRRRRTQRETRLPMQALRTFVFSSRWVSLALFSLAVYALYLSGMNAQFYLTTIPVEGTLSITATEVVQTSGLAGVHIFAADPNRAAENIAKIPGVMAARVTLNWPNDVQIVIEEDAPIAAWNEGSERYWITENGRLIPARKQSLGLLQINSDLGAGEEDGRTIFVPEDIYRGALQLQALLPDIAALSYRRSSGLSFDDSRGWTVYLGTGTDMQQKLVVYETIVAQLEQQGLTPIYISVSNQNKPYYLAQ